MMISLPFRSLIIGVIVPLILVADLRKTEARVLTRCEAAIALQTAGISRTWISNWVCLMENASRLNTRLVNGPLTQSSYSYGIFQINSREWCTRGRKGGLCNVRCEDLADDNLQDDIRCAQIIFNTRGFGGWDSWTRSCMNKPLPNVSQCRRR